MERRMSEASRKVLEKQLQLLSERNGEPSGQEAMAIIKLVELLEEDDYFRERDAKWEEHTKGLCTFLEAEEYAEDLAQVADEKRCHMQRRTILLVGSILLLAFFGSLLFWLL